MGAKEWGAASRGFREWLKVSTPKGARISVRHDGVVRVRVYCCGVDDVLALACDLEPGHDGRCFSVHKLMHFGPETRPAPRGG